MSAENISKIMALRKGESSGLFPDSFRKKYLDNLTATWGISSKDVFYFSRQLATMVNAGLPILKSIETLSQQIENKRFRIVVNDICQDIKNGHSLTEALEKNKSIFGEFFVYMTEVGETGGMLGPILDRVATYMEKANTLKRKIITAMTYPALVIVVAFGSVVFLLTTIIPTFSSLFAGFEAKLPAPTQFILTISQVIKSNIAILFIIFTALIILGYFLYQKERVRYWCDLSLLKIPLLGVVLKKNVISRFSRSLGTLLSNGVSIMDALNITSRTVGNKVMEKVVLRMRDNIKSGLPLIDPLVTAKVFPPMLIQMIKVGEESGKLGEMLNKVADFNEAEVDSSIEILTSIIEPVIIIILGGVLGTILVAMYLPMFELINVIK